MGAGRLGWIRLRRSSQDGFPNRIEALDWTIETNPFTPIKAGDTGVPDPGTLSMALLAAGAATLPPVPRAALPNPTDHGRVAIRRPNRGANHRTGDPDSTAAIAPR
jgi:hypothetical protein